MEYYIDTEFDGFQGKLISLALAPHNPNLEHLYIVLRRQAEDAWVKEHVIPYLDRVPLGLNLRFFNAHPTHVGEIIAQFLNQDRGIPHIIADWPDDLKHFNDTLITGPGTMVKLRAFTTELARVDAYPTTLTGAIKHNAMWDAVALRAKIKSFEPSKKASNV